MKTIKIRKIHSGQYIYRVFLDTREIVAEEYGTFDLESTIQQAQDRFGKATIEIL